MKTLTLLILGFGSAAFAGTLSSTTISTSTTINRLDANAWKQTARFVTESLVVEPFSFTHVQGRDLMFYYGTANDPCPNYSYKGKFLSDSTITPPSSDLHFLLILYMTVPTGEYVINSVKIASNAYALSKNGRACFIISMFSAEGARALDNICSGKLAGTVVPVTKQLVLNPQLNPYGIVANNTPPTNVTANIKCMPAPLISK